MDVFSNDLESMGRVTSQQRSAFQRVVKKAQAGRRRSQQAPARPPQARQAVAVRTPRNGAKRKPIARWKIWVPSLLGLAALISGGVYLHRRKQKALTASTSADE